MQNSLTKGRLAAPDASSKSVTLQRALAQKFQSQTKPPGSLGVLESLAERLALLQGTLSPSVEKTRICVFAGSHGIAQEGVSAYPAEVTVQMLANVLSGGAAVCVLARHAGASLHVIDCGVSGQINPLWDSNPSFFSRSQRQGTRSFVTERAMTAAECEGAMDAGREQVRLALADGIQALGLGEMGIANTTAASALFSALLSLAPEEMVGRGTGIDDAGLLRKLNAVKSGLQKHALPSVPPSPNLARHWLEAVGGYEIAAMTGAILEAADRRLPVVVDGFISSAAAFVASLLQENAAEVCFFAHQSAEAGHKLALDQMGVTPLLQLGMRLGEGSGSALVLPILKAAARLLSEMATFEAAGVSRSHSEDGQV